MQLTECIRVYVCGADDFEWSRKIARVLDYATVLEGVGVTREWGEERTYVVECWFNELREWSVYNDLLPILVEYKASQAQDAIAIGVWANGKHQLHVLTDDLSNVSSGETWEFVRHVVLGF